MGYLILPDAEIGQFAGPEAGSGSACSPSGSGFAGKGRVSRISRGAFPINLIG